MSKSSWNLIRNTQNLLNQVITTRTIQLYEMKLPLTEYQAAEEMTVCPVRPHQQRQRKTTLFLNIHEKWMEWSSQEIENIRMGKASSDKTLEYYLQVLLFSHLVLNISCTSVTVLSKLYDNCHFLVLICDSKPPTKIKPSSGIMRWPIYLAVTNKAKCNLYSSGRFLAKPEDIKNVSQETIT